MKCVTGHDGSECWAVKKRHEQRMQVAEMHELQYMSREVYRRDRIRNGPRWLESRWEGQIWPCKG